MPSTRAIPRQVWFFLLLAFGISWTAFFVRRAFSLPEIAGPLRLIIKYGPSLAGLIAAYHFSRLAGVLGILRRLVPARDDIKWILFAVLLPVAVIGIALPIRTLFSDFSLTSADLPVSELLGIYGSLLAARFFVGGGLGEELGWRGFMLPALQPRFGPLHASLIIGVFHGLWHFPAYSFGVLFLTGFTIAMAIIATWMYNHSKGSLFPIALLHANGNATFQFVDKAFPSLDNETGFALIAFLLWVVIAVMLAWRSKMFRIDDPSERRGTA